jgi:hypothetical protein
MNLYLSKLSLTAKGSSPLFWYTASNIMYTTAMPIQYKNDSTPVATKNCASDEKSPNNCKASVPLQSAILYSV